MKMKFYHITHILRSGFFYVTLVFSAIALSTCSQYSQDNAPTTTQPFTCNVENADENTVTVQVETASIREWNIVAVSKNSATGYTSFPGQRKRNNQCVSYLISPSHVVFHTTISFASSRNTPNSEQITAKVYYKNVLIESITRENISITVQLPRN